MGLAGRRRGGLLRRWDEEGGGGGGAQSGERRGVGDWGWVLGSLRSVGNGDAG